MPKIYSAGNNVPAADLNGIVQVAGGYAASATGNDSYVITVTPTPGSYTAGDVFYFKADVANTGAATLNVNGLGVKTLKKWVGSTLSDLEDGDIQAGQMVQVQYDGTYLQLINQRGDQIGVTVSDNLKTSADTERTALTGSDIKRKEIKISVVGSIRVKFDIKSSGGLSVTGTVKKNGAIIQAFTETSTSYQTKSVDITGVLPHDLIQLYTTEGASSNYPSIRNFRIYYDRAVLSDSVMTD